MIIKELLARLGFEVDEKGLKDFNSMIGEAAKAMAVLVGAGAAAAGSVAALAITTANAGDQAAKGAQRAGVTVEEYQKLSFAASKAGVSQEQLEASLKLSNNQLQKAIASGQDYIETTNGVRIAVVNADGSIKTQTQLMEETANAVQNATSAQDKLTIATAVYGEEVGARMIPLLNLGSEGMQRLGADAEALGIVMSEDAANQSQEFLDSLTDMRAIATGLRNVIGEQLIPVLLRVTSAVREWFLSNSDVIRLRLEAYARVLAEAIDGVSTALGYAIEFFTTFRAVGVATLAALLAGTVALGVALTASGILPLWWAVAAAIAYTAAQFAVLLAIYEDIFVFFQGGTSVIGTFVEQFENAGGIFGSVARFLLAFRDIGLQVYDMLGKVVGLFSDAGVEGGGAFSFLVDVIIFLIEMGLAPLKLMLDSITMGIRTLSLVMQIMEPIALRVWGVIAQIVGAASSVVGFAQGLMGDTAPAAAGLAPAGAVGAPAGTMGGGTTTINQTTYISGGSREEIEDAVDGKSTQRNRASLAEFEGAEV